MQPIESIVGSLHDPQLGMYALTRGEFIRSLLVDMKTERHTIDSNLD